MSRDDVTHDPELEQESEPSGHPLELALRHGLRYSGLRDIELDPRLLLYVPLEICERETVLPLSVTEEVLQVATAYPDPDLELVQGRFPALEVELVLAPLERIDELHDVLRTVL
jgi:Type II secretion system (T2SS), protein E, N-terminal domain